MPSAERGHGLRRDVDLLDALASDEAAQRGGLGVVRLAQLTGREKSQVSRALKALADAGIVERNPDNLEYQLGWRLFSLAARTTANRLARVAEPVMRRLSGEFEETTHLCVLRERDVLTVLSVSPGHSFRMPDWEGEPAHAACTSAGRVLLMDSTPDQLYVRFGNAEPLCGEHPTRTRTVPELCVVVNRFRELGYGTEDEEFEAGLVGASAPIRDFRGRAVAAINISAPKRRLGPRLDEAGRRLAAAAGTVSAQLGFSPRPPIA
ncbi:IclR family transcriptional regulator [Amycolatopsis sp. H20-H5]|uniref:IclR family transcriptional regulator n=1 Tax=Amycolatopsis sp. H20-H5 TaxID=3046309 RepID=UPI002DB83957|nr:IclR family transcriptional regulator [Amycolatopsis sp. H20-H5]MEC3975449.1 IclR family transcriptional regulator [Amycolatopsis sp. H20-H5]